MEQILSSKSKTFLKGICPAGKLTVSHKFKFVPLCKNARKSTIHLNTESIWKLVSQGKIWNQSTIISLDWLNTFSIYFRTNSSLVYCCVRRQDV